LLIFSKCLCSCFCVLGGVFRSVCFFWITTGEQFGVVWLDPDERLRIVLCFLFSLEFLVDFFLLDGFSIEIFYHFLLQDDLCVYVDFVSGGEQSMGGFVAVDFGILSLISFGGVILVDECWRWIADQDPTILPDFPLFLFHHHEVCVESFSFSVTVGCEERHVFSVCGVG
jgi:hypothetical protein